MSLRILFSNLTLKRHYLADDIENSKSKVNINLIYYNLSNLDNIPNNCNL